MNYFEARKAEILFREYKELVLTYWKEKPQDTRDRWAALHKVPAPESEISRRLREEINLRFPEVYNLAERLGVGVTWRSFPAPAVGGPVVDVNILLSAIDQEMGHNRVSGQHILDVIHRCIGTAELAKHRELRRLLLPWYWAIDVPAFLVRIPFLILRAAGVPPGIEENVISHTIKTALVILVILVAGYFGVKVTITDILGLLAK